MPESTASKALVDGLSFPHSEGYALAACRESTSEQAGRMYHVAYTSPTSGRAASVTYFADRPSAVASIRALDDEFTFCDAGSMAVRESLFAEIPGEGIARLASYLDALQGELLANYLGVLRGAPFRNDAFDGSPYK